MNNMKILSSEVIADLRSAAWLEQELHPELDRHRRHQMADICESDNMDAVWRILAVGIAELRFILLRILVPSLLPQTVNCLETPDSWTFDVRYPLPSDSLTYLKEKIHEYLVALVMADRMEIIMPVASDVWRDRADSVLAELETFAATTRTDEHAVHRPLWPL